MYLTDTTTYLVIIIVVPIALLTGIQIYRNKKKQGSGIVVIREDASWNLQQDNSKDYDIYITVGLQNMGSSTTIVKAELTVTHDGREYHLNSEPAETVKLNPGSLVKQQYQFQLARVNINITRIIDNAILKLTDSNNKVYSVTFEQIPRYSHKVT